MLTAAKPTPELTRLDPVAYIRLGFFVAFRVNLRDLTCARRWTRRLHDVRNELGVPLLEQDT